MSAEAAFATMKCYDDILEENLSKNNPKVKRNSDKRVITPTKIKCTGETEQDDDDATPGSAKQLQASMLNEELPPSELRLTRRLNTAMDLVDSIKKEKGENPVSTRYKDTVRDNVRQYKAWSKALGTDFDLES